MAPPFLGVHYLKIKVMAEFANTKPSVVDEFVALYNTYHTKALNLSVRLKTKECNWLYGQISPDKYLPPILHTVHE